MKVSSMEKREFLGLACLTLNEKLLNEYFTVRADVQKSAKLPHSSPCFNVIPAIKTEDITISKS